MKKLLRMSCIASVAIAFASCAGDANPESDNANSDRDLDMQSSEMAMSGDMEINTSESKLMWEGNMLKVGGVSLYGHKGNIDVEKGRIILKDGKITNGEIVIDMTTIQPTDDGYNEKEGKSKDKLVGHLSSEDFFAVKQYPTANFVITGMDGKKVMGEMTIRGITNAETIELSDIDMKDGKLMANGKMTLDRHKYNVSWEATQDKMLSDDLDFEFKIVAQNATM